MNFRGLFYIKERAKLALNRLSFVDFVHMPGLLFTNVASFIVDGHLQRSSEHNRNIWRRLLVFNVP